MATKRLKQERTPNIDKAARKMKLKSKLRDECRERKKTGKTTSTTPHDGHNSEKVIQQKIS